MEGCPKENISVIPGFVPPDEEELLNPKSILPDLGLFLEEHNPVVSANASGIVFYDGKDLYGLDMCIELSARLRNHYPNLGFVYAIAPNGHGSANDDWEYLEKMRRLIDRLQITPNFYLRICSEPFTPLLKRCDVFVRPTWSDGDANSVREALYLGKPAVASDVVVRPESCLTFKTGDIQDFHEKVDGVLRDYNQHKQRISQIIMPQPSQDLLRLYSHLLRK
jgi:glycosyltransferase involved in cell wall biosynthesis